MTQTQDRRRLGREAKPFDLRIRERRRPCTSHCPRTAAGGIDLGQGPATARCLLLAAAIAAADCAAADPAIEVDNAAAVPAAELDSVLRDFRTWAVRVYRYHRVAEPAPVTLKLTRAVPFGFYRGGTVILPPSPDRWEMLDNWVHELTHHALGHDSSFFFKEGASVHTLEKLFGEEGRVPATWPQFGQATDAWVALYQARGVRVPLAEALAWPRYRGATADEDFRSWQIYNQAGSFVGWYIGRHGHDAFRAAFAARRPAPDPAEAERAWLAAIAAKPPPPFDPGAVLPPGRRYAAYAARLR